MTKEQAKEIIEEKIIVFCREKVDMLRKLYELPQQKLKEQESQTLSGIALGLMYDVENLIPEVLEETGVKYPQMVWGDIQPKLSRLSFRYIDWDSFFANESARQQSVRNRQNESSRESYQRKITDQDAKGFIKNGTLLIPAGGLGVGSVVCLTLHIGSKPIWVIGLIMATATAGYVVFKNLFGTKDEHQNLKEETMQIHHSGKSQQSMHQNPTVNLNTVIESTCKENKKILVEWGKKLAEDTLCAWEEAEKK